MQANNKNPVGCWRSALMAVAIACPTLPALADNDREHAHDPAATQAYREGYNQVLDRNWAAARQSLTVVSEQFPQSQWVDDAEFWRCYAADELNEAPPTVFECYATFLERFDDSEWEDDVKRNMVRLAEQLERAGQPDYRQRVKRFSRTDDDRELLQILIALGEIGDERSVDVILERLKLATDEQTRARIVDVLEDIENTRVTQVLVDLIASDPSVRVRLQAVDALGEHQGAQVVDVLTRVARDTAEDPRLRQSALDELGDHHPPGFLELLVELARDPDPDLSEEAIEELGDFRNMASFDALIGLFDTLMLPEQRAEILDEIENYESPRAVEFLVHVARNDPDPRLRRAATRALGDMETTQAREALIEILQTMNANDK